MIHRLLPVFFIATSLQSAAEEYPTSGLTPEVKERFEAGVFDDEGLALPYRLLSPEGASADDKRPLLLFLHGFGERGDDNLVQLVHGGPLFASERFAERYGAYVLAPQCPGGNIEGTNDAVIWSLRLRPTDVNPTVALDRPMAPPMRAARRLVDQLIETLPIDASRVYVAGLSMGGYATWELAAREPEFWAAAMPICGGGDTAWAPRLAKTPVWVLHGDADGAVPVDRSREMVAAITAAGGRPVYTEFPGVGHDSWSPTFGDRFVWDWLFTQRREP